MKQAKLIKKQEIENQENQPVQAAPMAPKKNAVETVRGWISNRRTTEVSARQAFAALFVA